MHPRLLITSLAGLFACTLGPKNNPDATGSTTTDPSETSTAPQSTGGLSPTSMGTSGPTSTSSALSGTTSPPDTTGDDDDTFVIAPDSGIGTPGCDLSAQRCPEGQKCNPSAIGCSFDFCGLPICVPLVPDAKPPGEACSVLGDYTDGTDDCELGSVCLDPDEQGNGVCAQICEVGFGEAPVCATPGELCNHPGCQECFWGWCEPPCDPRELDACEPGEVCFVNISFFCYPDASGEEGQAGDSCEFGNACDPGLRCVDPAQVPNCDPEWIGCCTPFCSTDQPNTCPNKDQGEVCVPVFTPEDEQPPEFANLGYCALPP